MSANKWVIYSVVLLALGSTLTWRVIDDGLPWAGMTEDVDQDESSDPQVASDDAGPVSSAEQARVLTEWEQQLVAAAADEVARIAEQASEGASWQLDSHRLATLRSQLKEHDLRLHVQEELVPADDALWLEWLKFALICEMLEQDQRALESYAQLHEERPEDVWIAWRYAALLASHNPIEASQVLSELEDMQWRKLEGYLNTELLYQPEDDLERLLGVARMMTHWLEDAPDVNVSLTWVSPMLSALAQSRRMGSELPGLFEDREVPDRLAELAQERTAVYVALCEAILTVPDGAELGLKHLAALAKVRDKDLWQYRETALQVVLRLTDPQQGGVAVGRHGLQIALEDEALYRTPGEIIVREAWRNDAMDWLEREVLVALDQRWASEALRAYAQLYTVPELSFENAARVYFSALEHDEWAEVLLRTQPQQAIQAMLDVWERRKLDVDPVPIVMRELDRQLERGQPIQAAGFLDQLAVLLYDRGSLERVREMHRSLAELMIDSTAQREEVAEGRDDEESGAMQLYAQYLAELVQQTEHAPSMLVALEQMERVGVTDPQIETAVDAMFRRHLSTRETPPQERVQQLNLDELDEHLIFRWQILEFLDRTLLMAEADEFLIYRYGPESQQNLLSRVVNGPAVAVSAWLDIRPEQTFGTGLVEFLGRGGRNEQAATELFEYLVTHQQEFERLPDSTQRVIADLAVPASRELAGMDVSNQVRDIMKHLGTVRGSGLREQIEAFVAAQRLEQLNIQASDLPGEIAPLVDNLLPEHRVEAVAVLNHAVDLIEDAERRGRFRNPFEQASAGGWLLERIHRERGSTALLAACVDVIRMRTDRPIEMTPHISGRFERMTRRALRDAINVGGEGRLDLGLHMLAALVPEGDVSMLSGTRRKSRSTLRLHWRGLRSRSIGTSPL